MQDQMGINDEVRVRIGTTEENRRLSDSIERNIGNGEKQEDTSESENQT